MPDDFIRQCWGGGGFRGQWVNLLDSVYTNAISHQHGFKTSKLHPNQYSLEVFTCTWNRFRQKIHVVMVYESTVLPAKFTSLNRTMQISSQNSNHIQIATVRRLHDRSNRMICINAPLLPAFSNWPGFGNSLDWCRILNRRHNCIENDAVTNETAFVWTLP